MVDSTSSRPERTALVVGAGLVGTLCSAMLASRGWTVTLIEARPDPRQLERHSGGSGGARARSINLALSPRGIEALRSVSQDLVDRVVGQGIEMRGRMIHSNDPRTREVKKQGQDYGVVEQGEVIRSISRTQLGIELLDHVENSYNGKGNSNERKGTVQVRFETKLVEMDVRSIDGDQPVKCIVQTKGHDARAETFDFVVAGDGAYSKVRREMMRGSFTRFNFSQHYAQHSYLELSIPPGPNNSFSIEPNYLHIWPRGEFMLIALANLDKSFTLTLFAHETTFKDLSTSLAELDKADDDNARNPVVDLFEREFPDALELMGREALLQSWNENPKDGLITIECSPYDLKGKVVLIGDAAHAMVPFYGQGMNCGFEDVRVLSTVLDHFDASPHSLSPSPLPYSSVTAGLDDPDPSHLSSEATKTPSERLALALSHYTRIRTPSVRAIQKLAADNYREMASSVLSPLYLLRLSLDRILSNVFSSSSWTMIQRLRRRVSRRRGGGEVDDSDGSPPRAILNRGGTWESLYRMTTFRCGLAYEEVLERRAWQTRVIERVVVGTVSTLVAGVGVAFVGSNWVGRGRTTGVRNGWERLVVGPGSSRIGWWNELVR
ncbi:hypothetical protein JCM10212_001221 [Sporobolomyces blumeae]